MNTHSAGSSGRGPQFASTHWSVVLAAAAGTDPAQARASMEEICRTYWDPIYHFIRRNGHPPADAEDLTQDFFVRLIQKNALSTVDPAKGRFRSFLLGALKNFLANAWDKQQAQKRGGGLTQVPVEALETCDALIRSAEHEFDYRWAMTVLGGALEKLRARYEREGKSALFEALRGTLGGEAAPHGALGMNPGALKVAASRLRKRYRDLLREQVAQTVNSPEEVEDELRALFDALRAQ